MYVKILDLVEYVIEYGWVLCFLLLCKQAIMNTTVQGRQIDGGCIVGGR